MYNKIKRIIENETARLRPLQRELKIKPPGTLYVYKKNDNYYFSRYLNGKKHGINKKQDLIYNLARKEYLEAFILSSQKGLKMISNTMLKLSKSIDNTKQVLDKYHMLDKSKIVYSKEVLNWFDNKKSQNAYKPEHLKYSTKNGIKMRSKSERTIGNFLEDNNIPYLYEPELEINGKTFYPDFMILKEDGSIIIWEHLGLMNDPAYIQRNFYKLEEYRKAGYLQHTNLICTYEEDLLVMETLESILYRFILD